MLKKIQNKKAGLPIEFYEEIFTTMNKWRETVDQYRNSDDQQIIDEVRGLDSAYTAFNDFYEDICVLSEEDSEVCK